MNIWDHCLLSQKKFGGLPEDYFIIHKFLDSSKNFIFHNKHRMLLHNLFGIELCVDLFGNYIINSNNITVLIRNIATEHCKEDLSNMVPTLNDWFESYSLPSNFTIPDITDLSLKEFIYRPYLRSGLKESLIITCSNFGTFLIEKFFGIEKSIQWANSLPNHQNIQSLLQDYAFTKKWQIIPNKNDLIWLQENGRN